MLPSFPRLNPMPFASAAEYSDPLTIELLQLATLLMRCHTAKLGAQSHYRQQLLKFGYDTAMPANSWLHNLRHHCGG